MPRTRVARLCELPAGAVFEAEVAGRPVAVFNVDGEVFALDGICPHAGGRLGHGALNGGRVACPFHAWEFDCRTGEHDDNPELRVESYRVCVQDGDILVELPD